MIKQSKIRPERVWELILTCYGTTPFHPGKGTVVAALADKIQFTHPEPSIVKRRGIVYELDRADLVEREIFYKTYESWETQVIEKLVKMGWICVDVGANVGYHTLLLSSLVGDSGAVYAFEPSDGTFAKLNKNVQLNNANNVHLHKIALSNRAGCASLITPAGNAGGAHLANESSSVTGKIEVSTLDHFVDSKHIEHVDFIKVDIEGCECRFLGGAASTIKRFRPTMLIEINPRSLASFGNTAADIRSFLGEYNYDSERLSWHGRVSKWTAPPAGKYFNILATPNS
jgi:FkbM family methyltransferase